MRNFACVFHISSRHPKLPALRQSVRRTCWLPSLMPREPYPRHPLGCTTPEALLDKLGPVLHCSLALGALQEGTPDRLAKPRFSPRLCVTWYFSK